MDLIMNFIWISYETLSLKYGSHINPSHFHMDLMMKFIWTSYASISLSYGSLTSYLWVGGLIPRTEGRPCCPEQGSSTQPLSFGPCLEDPRCGLCFYDPRGRQPVQPSDLRLSCGLLRRPVISMAISHCAGCLQTLDYIMDFIWISY